MGWLSRLLGTDKKDGTEKKGLPHSAGRRKFQAQGTCDVCLVQIPSGVGSLFTTLEVLSSEYFFGHMLNRERAELYDRDPGGRMLIVLVEKHVRDSTDWCLCPTCAEQLESYRLTGRYWDKKIPLSSNAALAAGYAWLNRFDRWPDAIAFKEEPPPSDGLQCMQCGRRAYRDEQVSLIKAEMFGELRSANAIVVRFAQDHALQVFCTFCMERALRILAASDAAGAREVSCPSCGQPNSMSRNTPAFGTALICSQCKASLVPVKAIPESDRTFPHEKSRCFSGTAAVRYSMHDAHPVVGLTTRLSCRRGATPCPSTGTRSRRIQTLRSL